MDCCEHGDLFESSCVVVSHGVEPDPILNYGKSNGLGPVGELSWDREPIRHPPDSRPSPDPAEREECWNAGEIEGYFDGYRGVRISSTGKRFLVEHALIWNVIDPSWSSHWSSRDVLTLVDRVVIEYIPTVFMPFRSGPSDYHGAK